MTNSEIERTRRDVFPAGDTEALVPTGVGQQGLLVSGWTDSHSRDGGPGPHLALRQAFVRGGPPLVVHVDRVPQLLASMAAVALRVTQLWERDGEADLPGRGPFKGSAEQAPPGGPTDDPSVEQAWEQEAAAREDARWARRRSKAELLGRVHHRAQDVLAVFLAAEDDHAAADALMPLLDVTVEQAVELVTHLQLRELTRSALRRANGGA